MNVEMMKKFYDCVLRNLENDEIYLMQLQARGKYSKEAMGDPVMHRKIIRRNEWGLFLDKVKQTWQYTKLSRSYRTGKILPPEAYALYIDASPKSTVKAYIQFMTETNKKLVDKINGNKEVDVNFRRLDMNLYSAMMRSNSQRPYTLIDVDNKDILVSVVEVLYKVALQDNKMLSDLIVWVSETRGGYHFIINRYKKTSLWLMFQEDMSDEIKRSDIEFKNKTCLTPLPGTTQGGVMVKGWSWNDFELEDHA